jgi:hypothetical protein
VALPGARRSRATFARGQVGGKRATSSCGWADRGLCEQNMMGRKLGNTKIKQWAA